MSIVELLIILLCFKVVSQKLLTMFDVSAIVLGEGMRNAIAFDLDG